MREHGTYSCYVWGPASGQGAGCRCEPCREANRHYERNRQRRTAPPYVNASAARRHLQFLGERGVGLKTVAVRTGLSHGTLSRLMYGTAQRGPSRRIRAETNDRILGVMPTDAADGARVPAERTWENVRTLLDLGWTRAAISKAIGQNGRALQLGKRQVSGANARAIAALLDQPVPERPRRGRPPASDATLAVPVPFSVGELPDGPVGASPTDLRGLPWREHAACRLPGVPGWIFFPGRGDSEAVAAAIAVCDSCPVRGDCLETHLYEPSGIWGGTTRRQRRRLIRARHGTQPVEVAQSVPSAGEHGAGEHGETDGTAMRVAGGGRPVDRDAVA